MKTPTTEKLFKRIFAQPTAPFREGFVRAEIVRILTEQQVPHFIDGGGNLIAGVRSFTELGRDFRIALMAHMDHPGFHLDRKLDPRTYECRWYGGAPWKGMSGKAVRLYDPQSRARSVRGRILPLPKHAHRQDDGTAFKVRFSRAIDEFSAASFGGFDFPAFRKVRRGRIELIRTRAADDLAGCVIALGALLDERAAKTRKPRLVSIFTRAEEVGFVGCTHLLNSGRLPRGLWVISLEASKELPGAKAGLGPVLRIGDRATLFDSEFSALLWQTAQSLGAKFKFQRRLMDGGTCEATPLSLHGFTVAGLAVPLLNYHNGDPQDRPAAEAICLSDAEGARRLCHELAKRLKSRPQWRKERRRLIQSYFKMSRPLFNATIAYEGEF